MISRSTSGAWNLTPTDDLRASELGAGLIALNKLMAIGPKQKIAAAIIELLAATDRPPSLSDTAALARREALKKMAWEYPINVVETACRDWRKVQNFGRWWPAEQDLRALCEKIVKPQKQLRDEAESLLRFLKRREEQAQSGSVRNSRGNQPFGRTLAFVNDCMASHGPPFIRSYLTHRTCDFTEDAIFTMGFVAERLNQRAGGLLSKHGVKVVVCPDVTARIYDDEDRRAGEKPQPRKRSYGS